MDQESPGEARRAQESPWSPGEPERGSQVFALLFLFSSFVIFLCFLGGIGTLLAPFGIFWGFCGVLVSLFWVPLARLGCLWGLSGIFL